MKIMKCPSCGKEIPDNSKFCPECGTKIEIDSVENSAEMIPVEVPSVNNDTEGKQPIKKHNKKKKKIWLIVLLSLLIVGGITTGILVHQQQEREAHQQYLDKVARQEKEEYKKRLTNTVPDLIEQTYNAEDACQIVYEKWHDAIFNHGGDFNTVIKNVEDTMKKSEFGKSMASGNTKIKKEMSGLQNPYKGYENTYQLVLQLYDEYVGLYNQATNPTGSLETYNKDVTSKKDSFNTTINNIEIALPDIKSKIRK